MHVTIGNSDGLQQTLTGLATTHHTNSTIYVTKLVTHPAEDANAESSTENMNVESSRGIDSTSSHDISNEHASKIHLFRERDDTKNYRIATRSEPPSLTENNIFFEKDWLDEGLDFDLAWYMAANHSNDDEIEMPPFGSWTVFNSMVADQHAIQSDLDYFPVLPYAPNESVLKDYLDFLIDLKSDLEIDNIFCHSDQDVFYKISQIMWKNGDKYKGIINVMGGFHIFLVNLKILYKKYGLLGLRGWWVKSKIIADGSVDKALEGRHYSRETRLHKQM